MRRVPTIVIVVALSTWVTAGAAPQAGDCQFQRARVVSGPTTPAGPADVVSRTRILPQPDSPVVITSLDFSGSRLNVVPGFFEWQPNYSLQLMNVSDKLITDVRAAVHIRARDLSGVGEGPRWERTLAPGQRAVIAGHGGTGHGGFRGDDVTVDAFIESVTFDGCIYRPSQAIPVAAGVTRGGQ